MSKVIGGDLMEKNQPQTECYMAAPITVKS
jgi:hypothetical protein